MPIASQFVLAHNEIHLWAVDLDWSERELDRGYCLLNKKEQQQADRFLVSHARDQYIASHATLRQLLSAYEDVPTEALEFGAGEHGKPYLKGNSDLEFNLSHTRGRALIGLTRAGPIGVDIEHHRPGIEIGALAQRFFAPIEYQQLMQSQESDRFLVFYRIWTRKEAFIKATGQGLSFGLNNFTVCLQPQRHDCLLTVNDSAKLARQWSLGSVLYEEGPYSAAYAAHGSSFSIQAHKWSRDLLSS